METCVLCDNKFEKFYIIEGVCKYCEPFNLTQQRESCTAEIVHQQGLEPDGKFRLHYSISDEQWEIQRYDDKEQEWIHLHNGG